MQFVALSSQTCVLQSQKKFNDVMAMFSSFEIFNLRVPMPAFLKDIGHLFRTCQVCGQAPVDLTEQARADIGDIFAGNVIFGFVLLTSLIVLHLLFLHIPAY